MRSGRSTSSGYMPPLQATSAWRIAVSSRPRRRARPGRYQTGSMAILVTRESAFAVEDAAVGGEPAGGACLHDLCHIEPAAGDRDRRLDGEACRDLAGKVAGDAVAPRVERDDLLRVAPLRERADHDSRLGVGQVRPVVWVEAAAGGRQRAVGREGAGVDADGVAPRPRAGDDGAALACRRRAPLERLRNERQGCFALDRRDLRLIELGA